MAISAEKVRNLSNCLGMNLMDAKNFLTLREEQAILQELRENGTLEDKVDFLFNRMEKNVNRQISDRYWNILNVVDEDNSPLVNQGVDETIKPDM